MSKRARSLGTWWLITLAFSALAVVAGCGDGGGGGADLVVSPSSVGMPIGRTARVTATTEGSPAGASVTWTSDDASIATVMKQTNGDALITGVAAGQTTITASLGDASAVVLVTVLPAAADTLTITPPALSLAAGTTSQLTATITLTDGTTRDVTDTVGWSSDDDAIATVSATGLVSGVAPGTSTVTATLGALSAEADLTVTDAVLVSLAIAPANPSVPKGLTQQLTATGTFSDASTQDLTSMVTWTSSATAVATVSATGLVTAVELGNATLTAALGTINAQTTVTVVAPTLQSIAVTPANPTVVEGTTRQLTATGTLSDGSTQDLTSTATWTSSAAAVATVSATGLVTGVAPGDATITATMGAISGQTTVTVTAATLQSIAVTPANPSVTLGTTQQLTATGTLTNGTTQDLTSMATWTSSVTAVVTVSTTGLVTAVGSGTSTVTASMGAISGQTTVTVPAATLVSIAVTPAGPSVALGATVTLTATGTYSDGSTADLSGTATWASSNTAIATTAGRVVTGVSVGSADISATADGITGSTSVMVTPPVVASIAINPATATLNAGQTMAFTATAVYTDASTVDVTTTAVWDSTNKNAADVSNEAGTQGVVTAIAAGSTTITAVFDGVTGTSAVSVVGLVSIAITPVGDLAWGTTRQLTATGTYSNGSTADVTEQATWTSSDEAALTVNDAAGRKGLATALSTAGATVTAQVGLISGSLAIAGCKIVVNEVQVAGAAGTPSAAANEWVELASTCTTTQALSGLRLVYRSAAGTGDVFLLDLSDTLGPNEYRFYVHVAIAGSYPTASGSFGNGATGQLSGSAGGVGLRIGAAGAIVDSMGYGTATNAFVEGTVAALPPGGSSAARTPNRTDTDNNAADFAVTATPSPGAANP
ncbi:MAG: Ig-like domain-containing protein [Kofleriaceae bacterium]